MLALYSLIYVLSSFLKGQRVIISLVLLFFGCYGFAELEFKHLLDNYYSFAAVSDGATRISSYVLQFIQDALYSYYLLFLPLVIYLIYSIITHNKKKTINRIKPLIIASIAFILTFLCFDIDVNPTLLNEHYISSTNAEFLLNRIGLSHFLIRDIVNVIKPSKENVTIDIPIEKEEPKETAYILDETRWLKDIENEKDERILAVDNYLKSKDINIKNDDTGLYEGKNFIYFLVESLDYVAVDKDLTPTLYKMFTEGRSYYKHYTPKYSCTTGESEFIANTSLVPFNDVCTPNKVPGNKYPEALANLFVNKGYKASSYHNWNDQYYDRHKEHLSFGFSSFKDVDDLKIPLIGGWQSDETLIEKAFPEFISDEPFFAFIITSSMHWPYDSSSNLGDRYLKEVNAVHPDYPIELKRYLSKAIEFDKSLAKLLELLEDSGHLEDTVISLYSDHHPFKINVSYLTDNTKLVDRNNLYGADLTPFLFYLDGEEKKEIKTVNSTFDQVPTIANLFNLNYDARLYVGKDIVLDDSLVIYPNSDWINKDGIYQLSSNKFTSFNGKEYSDEEIEKINKQVKNAINYSYLVMNNDYFKGREYLANPIWIVENKQIEEVNK